VEKNKTLTLSLCTMIDSKLFSLVTRHEMTIVNVELWNGSNF